jgi:hypothetical protein
MGRDFLGFKKTKLALHAFRISLVTRGVVHNDYVEPVSLAVAL